MPHTITDVFVGHLARIVQIGGETVASPCGGRLLLQTKNIRNLPHVLSYILVVSLNHPKFLVGHDKCRQDREYSFAQLRFIAIFLDYFL